MVKQRKTGTIGATQASLLPGIEMAKGVAIVWRDPWESLDRIQSNSNNYCISPKVMNAMCNMK